MKTSYMKRSLMLFGAAAFAASALAETTFVDVTNKYLKEAAYLPAWQGAVGATGEGVAEIWNGAFNVYQVLPDMPAGQYTLTVNAFYRCGNNDFTAANMKGNDDLHTAYIYLGDAKTPVEGVFDNSENVRPADGEDFDAKKHFPNGMWDANQVFMAGRYLNTVTVNHEGGDLKLGIANTGCYDDEWCCFDNFKLTGPQGEVTIPNGDFSEGLDAKRAWDNFNAENKEKTPDMQKDGSGGGDYRKCGGSPYKYGQQVELPAGTYRFGMLCFHRYGSEVNTDGTYYHHKSGAVSDPYGQLNRTPADWFKANDYDAQTDYPHAWIFMSKNAECPRDLNYSEDLGDLTEDQDLRVRVKDAWEIHNGDQALMPHNNPWGPTKDEWAALVPYETKNNCYNFHDSGMEREAAAHFVAQPEKYYQYVEFTLDEPAKVWVGMGKNANSSDGYWHAWADQTLQMAAESSAVEGIAVESAEAAVEYYNLQGVRVANPQGLVIVKKGNKAVKTIIK